LRDFDDFNRWEEHAWRTECEMEVIKRAQNGAQTSTPLRGVDEPIRRGVAHRKRRQDEQKREGFIPSSAPGDAEAQYQMGCWHGEGGARLVEKDAAKAAEWFGKAAAQGHADARKKLDDMRSKQ